MTFSYELLPDADSGIDQLLWWKDHQHSSSSHCSPTWPGLFLLSLLQAQKVSGCSAWLATLSPLSKPP